jgi:hypothetical protein
MIDAESHKIIDYEIAEQQKQYVEGNTTETSSKFEKVAVSRLIQRWKQDDRSKYYTHDNDGRTRQEIIQNNWSIEERLDIGHASKAIGHRLDSFSTRNQQIFKGIKDQIKKWLNSILYKTATLENKLILWENTWRHFADDHQFCLHEMPYTKNSKWQYKADPNAHDLFIQFLNETKIYVLKSGKDYNTQSNESFNHVKRLYLDKAKKFSTSGSMRIEAGICQWNSPGKWKSLVRERLQAAALLPAQQQILDSEAKTKILHDLRRRNHEFRERTKLQRKIHRKSFQMAEKNADGYKSKNQTRV